MYVIGNCVIKEPGVVNVTTYDTFYAIEYNNIYHFNSSSWNLI